MDCFVCVLAVCMDCYNQKYRILYINVQYTVFLWSDDAVNVSFRFSFLCGYYLRACGYYSRAALFQKTHIHQHWQDKGCMNDIVTTVSSMHSFSVLPLAVERSHTTQTALGPASMMVDSSEITHMYIRMCVPRVLATATTWGDYSKKYIWLHSCPLLISDYNNLSFLQQLIAAQPDYVHEILFTDWLTWLLLQKTIVQLLHVQVWIMLETGHVVILAMYLTCR